MASWPTRSFPRINSGKRPAFAGTHGGWYPMGPEYAFFPRPNDRPAGNVIHGHRAHETARGTPKRKLPNVGSSGPERPKHYTSLLVAHAKARGFINGKPLPKKVKHV